MGGLIMLDTMPTYMVGDIACGGFMCDPKQLLQYMLSIRGFDIPNPDKRLLETVTKSLEDHFLSQGVKIPLNGETYAALETIATHAISRAIACGEPLKHIPPPMVWLDLETTGLRPKRGHILEVALVITDSDLIPLVEFSAVVTSDKTAIYTPGALDAAMAPFVKGMHTDNGLLEEIHALLASGDEGMPLSFVDRAVSETIKNIAPNALSPLCGSTIDFDRAWIQYHMPLTFKALHYRNVDVSSFREMAQRWRPDIETPRPPKNHRGMQDIHDSISLLAGYRGTFTKEKP